MVSRLSGVVSVVPTDDAHGSEDVALSDRRRAWLSGFDGSAGQAIVSPSHAYLVTDSRFWLQALDQLDSNWTLIRAGAPGVHKDWIGWIAVGLLWRRLYYISY
jgi:Xaa-Pro aminopeptidase